MKVLRTRVAEPYSTNMKNRIRPWKTIRVYIWIRPNKIHPDLFFCRYRNIIEVIFLLETLILYIYEMFDFGWILNLDVQTGSDPFEIRICIHNQCADSRNNHMNIINTGRYNVYRPLKYFFLWLRVISLLVHCQNLIN